MAASLVPEGINYKPLEVEDLTVPTDLIKHFGKIFKKEGFSPFDEQNLGNIPFYWVDQIYLSYDLERSIILKVNVELEEKKFESHLYSQGTNFVFHSRTKNKVPYVLVFTGFKDENQINHYINAVKTETDHFAVSRTDPAATFAKLTAFIFPSAEAAVTCTTNTHVLSSSNQRNIADLGSAAFTAIFDQLKGCLIAELRGARTALMAPVDMVESAEHLAVKAKGLAVKAGGAVYRGKEAMLRAEVRAAKSGYHFVSGFLRDSYQKGVESAMDNAGRKIASKAALASQALTSTAASASSKLSQSVTHAIDCVSQYPERLKAFFNHLWESVQKGWGGTLEVLKKNPAALYNLFCNLIGTIAAGEGISMLVGFLTGGTMLGPVIARVGIKVVEFGETLSGISPIFKSLIEMGESGTGLLMKLTGAIGKVQEAVLEKLNFMAKTGLKKLLMRAGSCAI